MGIEVCSSKGIDSEIQRRILNFLNSAKTPAEIIETIKVEKEIAQNFLDARDSIRAFGFREITDLNIVKGITIEIFGDMVHWFGPEFYGKWKILPYNTQFQDGRLFSTAHASLLCTGQVLFLPRLDESGRDFSETVLWDPTDETNPKFEEPVEQPDEFLFCSGHSFLSDGKLLAVGGGGNYISNAINSGWKFDPISKKWSRTKSPMHFRRWYPTVVTLGYPRVLIGSGTGPDGEIAKLELYNENNDDFTVVNGPPSNPTAADKPFIETYPGFHIVPPGGEIFFSRTGWGHGSRNEGGTKVSYFRFSGTNSDRGEWIEIDDPMIHPDRTEGMSVLLVEPCGMKGWSARVLIIGGGNPDTSGRSTAEMINLSELSPRWPHPMHLPEQRFNVNAVLLADGRVLVSGGMPIQNSPCRLFDPATHRWYRMAALNHRREYHSVALLLPSGKVMTTGGDYGNTFEQRTTIEIFSPPYLFAGKRPKINSIPERVHHGHTFEIESDNASEIKRVVFARPMAITHHTDTEQRVIPLKFVIKGNKITITAPNGDHPHAVAPRGYYMLFIINNRGVPSEGKFIHLH